MREGVIESKAGVLHAGIPLLYASRYRGCAVIVSEPDPVDGIPYLDGHGTGVEREIDHVDGDGGQ
jgi:hypothetical protein